MQTLKMIATLAATATAVLLVVVLIVYVQQRRVTLILNIHTNDNCTTSVRVGKQVVPAKEHMIFNDVPFASTVRIEARNTGVITLRPYEMSFAGQLNLYYDHELSHDCILRVRLNVK